MRSHSTEKTAKSIFRAIYYTNPLSKSGRGPRICTWTGRLEYDVTLYITTVKF
jgi:hypothetical protein